MLALVLRFANAFSDLAKLVLAVLPLSSSILKVIQIWKCFQRKRPSPSDGCDNLQGGSSHMVDNSLKEQTKVRTLQ